jgi:HK97 family phage prohead protease
LAVKPTRALHYRQQPEPIGKPVNGLPPKEGLFREIASGCEFQRAGTGSPTLGTLTGHFAVFNEWLEVRSVFEGHFMERFAPGAFKKTFQENRKRMRCIFRHGLDSQIGQKVLGPIERLEEDGKGASYEVPLFDTIYNRELLPGLEAGQYGSSFEFGIVKEDFNQRPRRSDVNPDGIPERTITEAYVREFGPCTFPQYEGTTAGIRSVTDDIIRERLEVQEPRGHSTVSTAGLAVPQTDTAGTNTSNVTVVYAPDNAAVRNDPELHRYRRSIERVGSTPWAMHPEALGTILAILSERASGYRPTPEEIQERIGARRRSVEELMGGPVAVLPLYGAIVPRADLFTEISGGTSIESFQADFRDALSSKDVQAIMLDIDSPGGQSDLVPELATEIRAARSTKPVFAVANTWAASAAYWIGSAATELIVTPSGQVGSIGVYSAHDDISAAQEKLGVKTTIVSAGKYKVEKNPFEPLSEEAKADMQAGVDETYAMFLKAVAKGRDTDVSNVRENFGQGRMVRPGEALKRGMVDGIATFDETLKRLTKAVSSKSRSLETEPEPSGATTSQELEPESSGATTQTERDPENFAAWKEQVAEDHRRVREYVNGIERS